MQNKKTILKRYDLYLFIFVLSVSLITIFVSSFLKKEGSKVLVYVDNKLVESYQLSENLTSVIEGVNGENILEISQGKASIISATCPDKLCVHQKDISKSGETIVCLPNRVIVLIESDEESDYDGYTN